MTHENLAAALAAFQAELPKLRKDETAKVTGENKQTGAKVSYTYGYADLAHVTEEVSPALGRHGLSFTSKPTMTPEGFGLVYALKHESGESDEGFWPLPDPARIKPQDLGSIITYWRRYAFMAITNTFPGGEDKDAYDADVSRDAWERATPAPRQTRATTAQAMDQHARGVNNADEPQPPKKNWANATEAEVAEQHKKLETLELEKALKLYDWMGGVGLHNRGVQISPTGGGIDGDGPLRVTATDVLAFRLADRASLPTITIPEVDDIREIAEARGLLKVLVGKDQSLDEALTDARDLHKAAAANTDHAAALRSDAAASFGDASGGQ